MNYGQNYIPRKLARNYTELYRNYIVVRKIRAEKPNSCGNIFIISVITVIFTSANSGSKWKNNILTIPALLRDLEKIAKYIRII